MEDKQLNIKNIQSINDCIKRMLIDEKEFSLGDVAFGNNTKVIKSAFRPCTCPVCPYLFSKMDIYYRLVLIDSLYFTNINQMRSFGLEEMTDAIWSLCDDGNGNHSDLNVAEKLKNFIHCCEHPEEKFLKNLGIGAWKDYVPVRDVINDEYGYIAGDKAGKAFSLLLKYFYFVALIQQVDEYGFPIYDRIVRNLIRPIEKYMGLSPLSTSTDLDDIAKFIPVVQRIVKTLETADPDLWNLNNSKMLKFELFYYFVWHIGKAGDKNYRLLFTPKEYTDYYKSNQIKLPKRIQDWEDMYNQIKK